jgi:hypothetical protein
MWKALLRQKHTARTAEGAICREHGRRQKHTARNAEGAWQTEGLMQGFCGGSSIGEYGKRKYCFASAEARQYEHGRQRVDVRSAEGGHM